MQHPLCEHTGCLVGGNPSPNKQIQQIMIQFSHVVFLHCQHVAITLSQYASIGHLFAQLVVLWLFSYINVRLLSSYCSLLSCSNYVIIFGRILQTWSPSLKQWEFVAQGHNNFGNADVSNHFSSVTLAQHTLLLNLPEESPFFRKYVSCWSFGNLLNSLCL